jgi:hypothetical protein
MSRVIVWAGAGAFFAAACSLTADELAEKGRQVFQKHHRAVVTLQVGVKINVTMPGRPDQTNETRLDVTATIIDPSGLAVVSLAATDPGQMIKNVMSSMSPAPDPRVNVQSQLSDLRLVLEDGAELPAQVVSRDYDLDLAFVRPVTKPAKPLPSIDLADAGKAQLLDQVLSINRLGNAANKAYAAAAERIAAVVEQPRLFYVPENSVTTTSLGAPAFTLDGKMLGLFVMRSIKAPASTNAASSVSQKDNVTGIILPSAEILGASRQVSTENKTPESGTK